MSKVYFISGHRNITKEEFLRNYAPALDNAANEDGSTFVMGDYYGADTMAQDYLLDTLEIDPGRVAVYHMFESPRNKNAKVIRTIGGFKSDSERDSAMTSASDEDIAFVRDEKKWSGTGENLLRRHKLR